MKYVIDVRDLRDKHIFDSRLEFFPTAVAAFRVPDTLPQNVSFMVWGVTILEPQQHTGLCDLLTAEVRQSLPVPLFVAGWSVITYRDVCGGEIGLSPYAPKLFLDVQQPLYDQTGKGVSLVHSWPCIDGANFSSYEFAFNLEQPYALMLLKISLMGAITLAIDTSSCIPVDHLRNNPELYDHDFTRTRQLRDTRDALGCMD